MLDAIEGSAPAMGGGEGAPVDFESMSVEQLEKVVPEQGAAPQDDKAAPVAENAERSTEVKAETPAQAQAAFDAQKAHEDLLKRLENLQREQGRSRELQSRLDKLPTLIEQALAKRQQQEALANMSDTDKALYQQQLQGRQQEAQQLEQQLEAILSSKYGDKIALIEQFQAQQADNAKREEFMTSVVETAGEDYAKLKPEMDKIWADVTKGLSSPDEATREAALARFDKLEASPAALVLEASRSYTKSATTQAQALNATRANAGKAASQSVASTATKVEGRKSLKEMTQAELDALPADDLEKRLAEEGA